MAGQDAPLFSGQDQDGIPWKLSDHIGKRVVFLYFYPKDDSAGCTAEACSLRDKMFELKQAGVDVVGVSFDDQDTHKSFIFKYNLDFPLLADTNGVIADTYGARMGEPRKKGSWAFSKDEIKDWPGLINRWKGSSDPVSAYLWQSLLKPEQAWLKNDQPVHPTVQEIVVQALNKVVGGPSIYQEKRFKDVSVRTETAMLVKQKKKPTGSNLAHLNRLLLEDAFPLEITRIQEIDRRRSFLIGLDGKIIHVTDSPDPAVHLKELTAALAKLRGN